jgi:hypothetical protein
MHRREFLAISAAAVVLSPYPARAGEPASLIMSGALGLAAVSVNGSEPHRFLIDTGAAVTVADPTLSRELRLDRVLPNTGPVRAPATSISVAGRSASVTPAVADLSAIAAALGQPVKGLLGSDFFSAFQVVLDFSAKGLTLNPGGRPRPANGMPMRYAGLPYVQAEVHHGRTVLHGEFALDTGLDTGVKLKDSMTMPLMRLPTTPATTVTVDGPKRVQTGVVDAVRVGGLDIPKLTAMVSQDAPPSGASGPYAGMIGAPAFYGRVLTLDYPGGWWSLSPVMI